MGKKKSSRGVQDPATMSVIEWYLVVDPSDAGKRELNKALARKGQKPIRNWPIEAEDVNRNADPPVPMEAVRVKEPLATFMREASLRKIDKQLLALRCDKLREEEVIGARLYTGPMFTKYNAVLRSSGDNTPAAIKKEAGILCLRNK